MKNTMKNISGILIIFLINIITSVFINAQVPEKIGYQAIIRDSNDEIISGCQIKMQISILKDAADGTAVYTETQTVTTDANGLVSINIGTGTTNDDFSTIDWPNGTYYIKTETDIDNDGTYDITGTNQILSVPYALFVKSAGKITGTGVGGILENGNDAGNSQIKNLADPTDTGDVATYAYLMQVKAKLMTQMAGGSVTDYDGNIYNTVKIGNQVWMAENLRVTHYPNGNTIANITDNTNWADLADNNTSAALCFYNNNANNEAITYGALYTYAAAIANNWNYDNKDGQGICPDGWHLPTDAEWTTLANYLGGTDIAGGKMKEKGTYHWVSPNTDATNESGFTTLPAGLRDRHTGVFQYLTNYGYWWSSTENNSISAYTRALSYNAANLTSHADDKSFGFAIRCVKD